MADSAFSLTVYELQNYKASQYVGVAGLVVLLWDHLLTFNDEVRLIWRARLSIPKLLFLFNRYAVPTSLIALTYATSGLSDDILPDSVCQIWFGIGVVLGMLSIGTSNFLVLLRLWVLWDRRTRLVLSTLILFVLTQLTSIVCTAYVVASMIPSMVFDPDLHACMLTGKVDFAILWSPGVVFELMVFIMTCWNALDQPLPQHAKMARVMYRDGSTYFFVLFGLRVVNLVLSIIAPRSLVFLGVFFIWSACNVTLTRLIMNLRRITDEAEESHIEEFHIDCPQWPVSPGLGSCASESYELQGKGS
ncbi:hypothetical protein K503DRAFT_865114 [Rhizopogon vinicolor AM-OR11-026]|uniref:DUF6533 domain-containing protein n=1 Tax=Rhizopogon vinicolor AM-OR11-026 TaxID=1314800 RepID=A0A1B7N4R6_9AGAM|nr:hypothetical protein K503DRAFT_865114 [Rhizopogon vinicolor AM-OR11-026]